LEDSLDEKVVKHVKKTKGKPTFTLSPTDEETLPLLGDFYQNILAN
jgi:hypothetical protein